MEAPCLATEQPLVVRLQEVPMVPWAELQTMVLDRMAHRSRAMASQVLTEVLLREAMVHQHLSEGHLQEAVHRHFHQAGSS